MQADQNWNDVRFELSRYPRFDRSTQTEIEDKRKAREDLAVHVDAFIAGGGKINYCPAMTVTSREEQERLRAEVRENAVARNVREAA